tara:strand:- start:1873 stop:2097 length:225 start_codon:yes stop_codon:yes gene_type:complete
MGREIITSRILRVCGSSPIRNAPKNASPTAARNHTKPKFTHDVPSAKSDITLHIAVMTIRFLVFSIQMGTLEGN